MLSFIFAARNKPVEGAVLDGRCLIPDAFVTTPWAPPRLGFQRDSQTRPHRREATETARSGHVPASPARATARDLWGFARIYVCSGRRVWLPRPHPRRVTHVGPGVPSEPDVPDRRSCPVRPAIHHRKKSRSPSSPRLSSWIYTSRGCVRVVHNDRPADRSIVSRILSRYFSHWNSL